VSAADFASVWPTFARPLSLESADGLTTATTRGVLRGLRTDELVAGLDAGLLEATFLASDLEAVGFLPLPKFARIVDGSKAYTVEEAREVWAGTDRVWVKAWVRG